MRDCSGLDSSGVAALCVKCYVFGKQKMNKNEALDFEPDTVRVDGFANDSSKEKSGESKRECH